MLTTVPDEPLSLTGLLARFRQDLADGDVIATLRAGQIGKNAHIDGPFGSQPLIYADYVASGRALAQVESFILNDVLPYYANSHTEASYCGGFVTRLRRAARQAIARCCGAGSEHAVIFAGSGATAGLNRLVNLLGVSDAVAAGQRVIVILGPYEHHSNILPWRESGAEIIEIGEAPTGGPALADLDAALAREADLKVCSFSAASNVTGIVTDIVSVTRRARSAGARMVWDYAGAGPYLPIDMSPAPGAEIDAIVVSPHKFVGGPGASGVMIVRRAAIRKTKPTWPGGGTVKFVSPTSHDYSDSLEAREEAGTPNVLGDIRAALCFLVKDAVGTDLIRRRNAELGGRALAAWQNVDRLEMLGVASPDRLPIFSFRVRDGAGGLVHHQLITRMLSDRFGIQARGGCACAGPYVHRLLAIDARRSEDIRHAILDGQEMDKPGFTRLNFSFLLDDYEADEIIRAVRQVACDATQFAPRYEFDAARAIFFPRSAEMSA